MAIAKTGAMFKTLTFDSQSSRNYGVYITGEAVYNAPDRDVDMITIPGRNGAFAKDNGRFKNIEVTYPAGIAADNEQDFAKAISDFRNMLCARKGYCRLTDDYNSDEYRLAVYKSGLEVSPALLRAGEFEITFECQPQRFLTSGETKSTITNGGTLTNPTLFESKPLLEVYGDGMIHIGNDTIDVDNALIGMILVKPLTYTSVLTYNKTFSTEYANIGDTITLKHVSFRSEWICSVTKTIISANASIRDSNGGGYDQIETAQSVLNVTELFDQIFSAGTSRTVSTEVWHTIYLSDSSTLLGKTNITVSYDGDDTFAITCTITTPTGLSRFTNNERLDTGEVWLDSTKSVLGYPLYIDLDVGEAYKIENNEIVSVNNAVTLPANLSALKPGANTITFDNTITRLDITPRWWKL